MNGKIGNKAIYIGMFEKFHSCFGYKNLLVIDLNCSTKGDHSPGVNFLFILFNYKILEIDWYDTRHKEIDDE